MPDDERESDDLFEDLDKFFAPIKEVDWDEPAEATPATGAEEEHVIVRGEPEVVTVPPTGEGSEPADELEGEDDGDWYDTASLEPVGHALGGTSDPGEATGAPSGGPARLAPDADEEDQGGLFARPAGEDEWPIGDEEDAGPRPSDEELEEATAHFAGDAGEPGQGDAPQRVVQIDEETAGDLLEELGAEPYPAEEEDEFAAMAEEEPPRAVVVGADGLGGPSWQEPAAVEVGADLDRRGSERDVPAAFLTGIVLAAIAIVSLLIGEGVFAVVAGIVALVAQGELYGVMVKHHRQPATAVGLVSGALVLAGAYFHGEAGLVAMLSLGLLATFLWYLTVPAPHRRDVVGNIGLTLLGLVWVPALAGSLLIILTTFDTQVVVAVIALTFVFDTLAFLTGSVWGGSFIQRPLAPATSPKKSIEGLIAGTLGTIIISVGFVTALVDAGPGIFEDSRLNAVWLGVIVSLAATFGDLAESLIKRDLGVKDMGSVLPGHGGVLDRIDSLLFVAPAALLLLRVIAY
ncbi:MAG TPA: phosphatidate cytidylyltransferase [Actinomycetota bacterium]|nr:phosphatidate cytidylyltransferase [Actinomycetota bacterium]